MYIYKLNPKGYFGESEISSHANDQKKESKNKNKIKDVSNGATRGWIFHSSPTRLYACNIISFDRRYQASQHQPNRQHESHIL